MALDFQRPDPSSPAAVASAQFSVTRRGYREEEVRDFLRQVSVEMARLLERERFLENELRALQARGPADVATIDEDSVAELLGAETARVLSAAREAAQAMRDRAVESAEQIVREASREAARSLEEATLEAARRRSDVSSEAEQELELAKQQGREIVAEVRAYRERVLEDLAKRTEEARRELERLVHERERLLGAFERARHAASDVVGDLTDFDEVIRDAGIVPPLVPPDAPPPPNPTRPSTTPIFDAMEYQDELGTGHRDAPSDETLEHVETVGVVEVVDAVDITDTVETVATVEHVETIDHAEDTDVSEPMSPAAPREHAEPAEPVESTESTESTEPATGESMAPVVNLLERRRRKDIGVIDDTTATTSSRDVVEDAPTDDSSKLTAARAVHPVFERVEARDEPVAEPPPPSRVDAIFERLRSASAQKVSTQEVSAQKTPTQQVPTQQPPAPPDPVRPHPVDDSVFRVRDEAVGRVIESMIRAVKRLLADEENAALTHVGTKRSILTLDAMLPTLDERTRSYVVALREQITAVAVDAARSLSDSRRSDLRGSITNGAVFDGVSAIIANDFVTPVHERIREAIDRVGANRDDLSRAVRSVFFDARTTLVEPVIADVAHFAYARGLFLGCSAGSRVCWAVDPNGPACADAEDNALSGVVGHGDAFPTGHMHPLAHAGCRCLVVPTDL